MGSQMSWTARCYWTAAPISWRKPLVLPGIRNSIRVAFTMFNFGRGKLREYCQAASLFVNVVCVVAGAGRFADWLSTRSRIDLEFSVGFLLTSILIFAFS